ncbi:MAG: phosphate acetyltransferase [Desulfobacterales bacterium RIFOXYA12_FULL_46_15]|nr:MAG: phosphate acetyltransferase [Desulfobacterales bacterium RIFOXYA12_FULL_46_15]
MAKNLFITATEARSGKSAIALGIMELLIRNVGRVGFFRPLIHAAPDGKKIDNDIHLFSSYFKLGIPEEKMFAYTLTQAGNLIGHGRQDELLEGIFNAYREIEKDHDFILCEGIELEDSTASFEFDLNAQIIKNLGCPVLLVANARHKPVDDVIRSIRVYHKSFINEGCEVIATIVNRTQPQDRQKIISILEKESPASGQLIYAVPDDKSLGNPTIGEIAHILGAEILYGSDRLNRHVHGFTVAAMQLRNFLKRIEHGMLVITPGDRSDVIVACLSAVSSMSMPNISGILLTGGLKPEESVCRLIEGFSNMVPILSVTADTFPSAILVSKVHAGISPDNDRKITKALEIFDKHIDSEALTVKIIETRTTVVTPKMFEYRLLQKAKADKQRIVLPEGEDERILYAAEILLRRDVVDLILLGNEERIRKQIARLGLRMDSAVIMDIRKSKYFNDYVQHYYDLRKDKGMTLEAAKDFMSDVNFFGTMMVHKGDADGMVSGAVHTTQATIRPAFEIIRTKPGFSVVSSVFFMCLKDRVLVYGDCAINPDPDAGRLAEIAVSSAQTARIFDIDPRVAMLSYSTGESGKGEDVEKVRKATQLAREMSRQRGLDLKLEGPIQYDAAIDPIVAGIKMPDSEVAGKATVFIFPDLNTGNNTYKAVQRSAGAVAVGPVLQGLKKPVNDLSRGCLVSDVVNTIAITAIQARAGKELI